MCVSEFGWQFFSFFFPSLLTTSRGDKLFLSHGGKCTFVHMVRGGDKNASSSKVQVRGCWPIRTELIFYTTIRTGLGNVNSHQGHSTSHMARGKLHR